MATFALRTGVHVHDVAATASVAATDGAPKDVSPSKGYVLWTVALIAAGIFGGWGIFKWHDPIPFVAVPGVSVFAVFYVVAQAIERLQEPFAPYLGRTKTTDGGASTDQKKAKAERDKAVMEARKNPDLAATAAKKQRDVDQIRANLTLLLWGSSSFLAMIASGYFGMFILSAVGLKSAGAIPDIIVTGMAVGAGTKPLHDLISNLQQSSNAKQDPPETT